MAQTNHSNSNYPNSEAASVLSTGTVAVVAGAVGVLAVLAFIFSVSLSGNEDGNVGVTDPANDLRPVGAGTLPDGTADELQEGLANETKAGDVIEGRPASDPSPNPLLDVETHTVPQASSIEELEPGPGVNDEVLERMAPAE
ncbi:hypothetical protein [Tropicimonas sp. S265A]|uniref:hypothetical protein n=1 Tax=Tropicimonas sp. S265A TaxID=3415134 RepID=UPI003C7B702E